MQTGAAVPHQAPPPVSTLPQPRTEPICGIEPATRHIPQNIFLQSQGPRSIQQQGRSQHGGHRGEHGFETRPEIVDYTKQEMGRQVFWVMFVGIRFVFQFPSCSMLIISRSIQYLDDTLESFSSHLYPKLNPIHLSRRKLTMSTEDGGKEVVGRVESIELRSDHLRSSGLSNQDIWQERVCAQGEDKGQRWILFKISSADKRGRRCFWTWSTRFVFLPLRPILGRLREPSVP
jgi:hypothetical protein